MRFVDYYYFNDLILLFHSRSNDVHKPRFYHFSTKPHFKEQREGWLAFIRQDLPDYVPLSHHRICSRHFANGVHSNRRDRINFLPTIRVGNLESIFIPLYKRHDKNIFKMKGLDSLASRFLGNGFFGPN